MVKEKWASTPYYARWLAAFFICSCLGFFIGMGLWAVSANADETDNSVYIDRMDVMPLGLEALAEGDHEHEAGKHDGWTQVGDVNSAKPSTPGKYYLTASRTIGGSSSGEKKQPWVLSPKDGNGEYTICLNGHTLTSNNSDKGTGNVIIVESGVILNLCDCQGNGNITSNVATSASGAKLEPTIIVKEGGTLNLYSGNISGRVQCIGSDKDSPQKGGAVQVVGTFHMYGGKISNNNSDVKNLYTYGGGVYVDAGGKFYMHNGEISGNYASNQTSVDRGVGGGVYVASNGTFEMTNGKISGNANDGVYVDTGGKFDMTGGEISGNKSRGVGIYGTGSMEISGNAVVRNNVITSGTTNTYRDIVLGNNGLLTIDESWKPAFGSDEKTSIYYVSSNGEEKIALTTGNDNNFIKHFVSSFPDDYAVIAEKNENGKYVLYEIPIEDVVVESFTVNTDKVVVEPGGSAKIEVSWTPEVPDCDVSVTFHTGLYDLNNGYNKYITSADSPKYVEVHTKDNIGEATLAISLTRKKDNKIETLFTKYVELVVTNAPKITKEPEVPDGIIPGYSPAERVMQVKASGMNLKYQWYYNQSGDTTDLKNSTTTGYDSTDCTIPDLDPGTYYFFCVITNEKGTATTKTVKITFPGGTTPGGNQPSTGQTPSIPDNGQPEAPSVPEGQSPVGKDIQVNVSNPGGKELKYQWYYNQTGEKNPENSTATGGNSPSCTIPDLAPGTYYFYCVITYDDGKTIISNTVPITIPEKAAGEKLEPGKTITTNDGTEVKRSDESEDGGKTVTIDKGENGTPDGTTDVTIILPEDKKDGEVTVDKTTGEVTVPGGSTVKDGDGTGEGSQKPDIVIGDKGGSVTPEGEVKIPEGGTATVGGDENKTGTTITGGSGNGNGTGSGSTIKPNENGTVDVTGGTTVTIGGDGSGDGENGGTDINLPNGGNVNPDDGTITPDKDEEGNQIAGVDTDGDGKVDTLIVLPGTDGGDSDGDKLKPDETGGVTLPAGTEIKGNGGSGSGDGTGSGEASITLPEGGTVTPEGGIKPEGGNALTGEDKNIEVNVPDNGVIKGDGEGGLTVPGGTTIQNGDEGSKITIDDNDGKGGTIDGNGNITIPEGGSATVDNGTDESGNPKPETTITAPKGDGSGTGSGSGSGNGGSTITPNPDGTTGVSGGTTVKTGEDGTEVTVNDNDGKGGTVNKDGDIVLPPGGSVTVGGNGNGDGSGSGDGNKGGSTTTITVPSGSGDGSGSDDGTGSGENTTIRPGTGGNVEVPNGSKVQTDNGSGSGNTPGGTPGGDDGDNQNNSTEITLPNGGNVNAGDGTITPDPDENGKQIAGVDTNGDGKVDTLIVLPGTDGNGTITPNDNGGVNVPGGTEIKNGGEDGTGKDSESTIIIGDQGGSVNNEGGVDLPKGGSATVNNGTDENGDKRPTTEITAGENGGTVKPNPEGGTDVSGQGTKVQVGGEESSKPAITVDDKGGTVTPEGNIEIKDGASVTVGGENGQPGTTITAPTGKDDGNGGTTGGSTTVTPKDDGSVDVGQNGTVTTGGKDGQGGTPVTLPAGGNVQPEDGTIKPTDNIIATGEDKDGNGIPDTVIILPDDKNTITPGDDGSITLPGGSTIQGSDGVNVTLPEGGQITSDGGVKPSGDGDLTIKGEDGQPDVSIKLPEGGAISGGENGGLQVPEGTEIKKDGENTPTVVVGDKGGSLDKEGNITLPEGGSATITGSDGKNQIEITTPKGGTVDTATGSTTAPEIEINGTKVTAPTDGSVITDKDGVTQVGPGTVITAQDGTKIEITDGNATLSKEGILTFPDGGKVKITKEDGTTQDQTVTNGGTIDIKNLGGSGSGPSGSSGHGGSSGGGASSNAPVISKTEHGTVSITPTRPQTGDKVTLTAKPEKGYQVDSVTVTDKDGKNVTVTKNSDGTYSFTQPEGKVTISVKFRETSTTQPAMTMNYKDCGKGADCLIGQFTDCLADAWYHDGIHYCLANGLMNGTSTTTFGPNESTTRGQIVTILYRVEGEPAAGSSPFSDVASGQYYAKAVAWGAANGIVKGYSEIQFAPEDKVTREQLAAILFRYAQFKGLDVSARGDLSSFSDSGAVSGYAVEAMEWAVGSGLMNGDNGALRPAGNATRAEMAMMLMRFLDK